MSIMNWWLGKINKSGVLAQTKPHTHKIYPELSITAPDNIPTPQNPGSYHSISTPQLDKPDFCTAEAKQWSEEIKLQAKEGKVNAIAVMNNLQSADEYAVDVEEYFYGDYRKGLANNYKRRVSAKASDMRRMHGLRTHQEKTLYGVRNADKAANEAILEVGKKKEEIAESWWD
ncbi:MAG: hypothetical protein F6K24_02570 [Okeania sp. SIO2D1]|nr:hypothetical protein [Okeania sp. SIO2D1]